MDAADHGRVTLPPPDVRNTKICCTFFGLDSILLTNGSIMDPCYEVWGVTSLIIHVIYVTACNVRNSFLNLTKVNILTIKPTRSTNFSNLFLE